MLASDAQPSTGVKRDVVLVLGTGSIGMRHLEVMGGMPDLHVVAIPTRPERVEELRRAGVTAVPSIDDARELRPVAAVVATDTARHVEDTMRLLELGCHVLVEKPLGATSDGLRDLKRVSVAAGRRVFVGCCLRAHDGLRAFRERVPVVGEVHHVRVECQSFLPEWRPGADFRRSYSARAGEGGVLRDLVHEIDYACWMFGVPAAVTAVLTEGRALGIASDAAADLLWSTPSGATVSLRLDYLTRSARRRMTAFGSAGELTWDAISGELRVAPAGGPVEIVPAGMDRDAMMRRQAEWFVAAMHGRDAGDLATLDEGAAAVALLDAARASSAARRTEGIRAWEAT